MLLKLGTIIVHQKNKKQNDIFSAATIANLSTPIYFCPKNESSICNFLSETKGATWNRHSSHVILTPINRLCRVDGSWFKTKTGVFNFYYNTSGKTVVMTTAQGCHSVSVVMHNYGAKFQEHCFNISRDIVYSAFYNF